MSKHDIYIKKIIKFKVGGNLLKSKRILGGHSGYVYAVSVKLNSNINEYIIKLSNIIGSKSLRDEKNEQRVYGGHSKSLAKVHNLLKKKNLKTFTLISHSLPNKEIPYFYQLISKLNGFSVREHLVINNINKKELFELAGVEFAKLHLITRNYDGWVEQDTPYNISWEESFFSALDFRLKYLIENKYFNDKDSKKLIHFIKNKKIKWTSPKEYVFSHVDGLQGMVEYKKNNWIFNGHIDLEDYRFTDQRFVLAGFEIGANYSTKEAPINFWDGYLKFKKIDKSYHELKDLFKVFYFMSWIHMTALSLKNDKLSRKISKIYIKKIKILMIK
ncbi:TPA: hypothetical protein DIC38_00405 [Candidatus Nomurabacteria bacterium]|nr:MAG: hypothetical protein O210_OD1C00001G0651 [Parcubacteria bacterium RAAC4_OD1_1]HCY26134.1 hypothetical protein [Candidatus Nomurabacteria bacterium]